MATDLPGRLNVLYIGFQDLVHPLFDDFMEAIDGKHSRWLCSIPRGTLLTQFKNMHAVSGPGRLGNS